MASTGKDTPRDTANDAPPVVLVIDDSPILLALTSELLEEEGYAVRAAESGQGGLEQAFQEPLPDIILLDIMMPEMDGFAVLKCLKDNPKSADIPVIFLTSLEDASDQEAGLKAGAVDYLSKPIHPAILNARLHTHLALKQSRDALARQNDWLETEVQRRVAENTQLEQRLQLALEGSRIGIWEHDQASGEHHWDATLCHILGLEKGPGSLAELLALTHQEDRPLIEDALAAPLTPLENINLPAFRMRHRDGHWLWLEGRGHLLEAAGPEHPARLLGTLSDISQRKEAAERIHFLSSYDPLTHLPNRQLFGDRLAQALLTANRFQRNAALLLLNLNRFRMLNDTLGPQSGDAILIEMANRLSAQLRDGDTIGRLSGNEFGVVLANLSHEQDAIALAQRLLDATSAPLEMDGRSLVLTASIGISMGPRDGETGIELLRCADAALQRAKTAGQNNFRFYSPQMDANAARRMGLEAALRQALDKNELEVFYQPQVSLDTGKLLGMEALLRWKSEIFGPVGPDEFIPIAEETGQILPIGEWVLRSACQQTKHWIDLGLSNLRVAVNLSTKQFRQPDLIEVIQKTLAESHLPAKALELEITESAFIDDEEEAVALCRRIKALGVKLSLDDFGTGYSSLAYISRFPFDKLKIDKAFVNDIVENPVNAAIASAAIVMARSLNLSVLAEGVETEAQASFLRGRRCDAMQGYLFSRPLPAGAFQELLVSRRQLSIETVPASGQPTLLLVDDEPNILAALSRLFRREGYNILTAGTPGEAFDLLACNHVHVILCDQRLPEMSGTELLARAKQLYPATVRILLTGYTDPEAITEAINRGAVFRFLSKPWDDDELREQIRAAFRIALDFTPESSAP